MPRKRHLNSSRAARLLEHTVLGDGPQDNGRGSPGGRGFSEPALISPCFTDLNQLRSCPGRNGFWDLLKLSLLLPCDWGGADPRNHHLLGSHLVPKDEMVGRQEHGRIAVRR